MANAPKKTPPKDQAPAQGPKLTPNAEQLVQFALAERQRRVNRLEELDVHIHRTRREAEQVLQAAVAERQTLMQELKAYEAALGIPETPTEPKAELDVPADAA